VNKKALLAKLNKAVAKPAKGKRRGRPPKAKADALGVSGKPKTVSRVKKRGTAKAKRQATAKSPRRISTKAKPDPKGFSKVTTTKKAASNLI